MRRPLAVLLVLFFALGPCQAVFGAGEDVRLPACCRRHGAHRCEMSAQALSALEQGRSSTPKVKAPDTCPEFPGFVLGNSKTTHALAASQGRLPVLLEQTHEQLDRGETAEIFPIRLHSGRAPPASL
jgi:hypothetical protein